MEESQERLDRLAMLHKHARSNYQDVANINYVITNCEDANCTNKRTTHVKLITKIPNTH